MEVIIVERPKEGDLITKKLLDKLVRQFIGCVHFMKYNFIVWNTSEGIPSRRMSDVRNVQFG